MKLPRLPRRKPASHKGDFGRVLVVAGSTGMCGAAILTSEAAYRSGAGLVFLAARAELVPILSIKQTCGVVKTIATANDVLAIPADVVAIGPGLGLDSAPDTRTIVQTAKTPAVVDADALNAFAEHPGLLAKCDGPRVLTPHPGELARLTTKSADRKAWARDAAKAFNAVVVLKGHGTVVTDGTRVHVNTTGNPGMATGGAGDVLTGIIAALIGQKLDPFDAAVLGVYVHGLAGDFAARKLGELSLMATDILSFLPDAFRRLK